MTSGQLWWRDHRGGNPAGSATCIERIFLSTNGILPVMKIVAALTDPNHAVMAQEQGADLIELRLDLFEGDLVAQVRRCREQVTLPLIATLRSAQEGGRYLGNAEEWMDRLSPLVPLVDSID